MYKLLKNIFVCKKIRPYLTKQNCQMRGESLLNIYEEVVFNFKKNVYQARCSHSIKNRDHYSMKGCGMVFNSIIFSQMQT